MTAKNKNKIMKNDNDMREEEIIWNGLTNHHTSSHAGDNHHNILKIRNEVHT